MKICALGDSIFEGFLVGGKSMIYYLVGKGYDIDNFSVNGLTSGELLCSINSLISYDKYIVNIGLNDFLNGDSLDHVLENIEKIVKKLKYLGGEIYIVSPYLTSSKNLDESYEYFINFKSLNEKIEDYDRSLKEKSEDFKVISFYDYAKKFNIEDDLIDGIHPNRTLHKKFAKYLEENLNGYIRYFK